MKELALTKNELAHRVANGFIATTKIRAVGFSSKLALLTLFEKLRDKDPYCSIKLLTEKAGRVVATKRNRAAMARRIPRFRIQLLEDGILLLSRKDSSGQRRIMSLVLFHKEAGEEIIQLALAEIKEREAKGELTKARANQMRQVIMRTKPNVKLVKQVKEQTQFLLSFE